MTVAYSPFDQVIPQFQNEKIARTQSEIRCFAAVGSDVAITDRTASVDVIVDRQLNLQDSVAAAQIFGFLNQASRSRTLTGRS